MALNHLLPTNLKFDSCEESGRGVYAAQDIPKGSEIFTAQPLGHVASLARACCHGCLAEKDDLLRCSVCKKVRYCNRVCQRTDWPLHRKECTGFYKVSPHRPTDTMRLVMRLLLAQKASTSLQKQLDYLMSNVDKFSAEVKSEMLEHAAGVAILLAAHGEPPEFTSDEIFYMLGKVISNAFNIMDCHHEEELGVAVYGLPSIMNHSCDPNTIAVFKGATMCIRSVKSIAPEEQLTISYYEVLESQKRRHAHLSRVYCFTCACSRCQLEDLQSSQSSSQAIQEQGYQLLDKNLKDMESAGNWSGIVKSCKEFIVQAKGELQPADIVVARVTEQLMRGQLELEEWLAALETGNSLSKAYRVVLPEYHPVYVLHLMKMAKLRRFIGPIADFHQALRELAEAEKLVVVTFGSDSVVSSVVKELMGTIRLELSALKS